MHLSRLLVNEKKSIDIKHISSTVVYNVNNLGYLQKVFTFLVT